MDRRLLMLARSKEQFIEGYCWAADGDAIQSEFTVRVNGTNRRVTVNPTTGYWRYDIDYVITSLYFCLRADSTCKLKSVNFQLDWSEVTDVSYMCYLMNNTEHLESITGNFAWTNKCKTTHYAFNGCAILTEIDLSKCDFSGMTDMRNMFASCYSLKTIHKNKISTVNECNIDKMFINCYSLESYGDDYLDMSGVKGYYENFNPFFAYADQLNAWLNTVTLGFPSISSTGTASGRYNSVCIKCLVNIPVCGDISSGFSFENSPLTLASAKVVLNALQDVTDSETHPDGETLTFSTSTKALINADTEALSIAYSKMNLGWNIPSLLYYIEGISNNASSTFTFTLYLNSVSTSITVDTDDTGYWKYVIPSNKTVTSLYNAFINNTDVVSITFSKNFVFTSVTSVAYAFKGCTNLVSINGFKITSACIDARYMMQNSYKLTNIDLSDSDTRNVGNFSYAMICNNTRSNANVNISNLNLSSVTNMSYFVWTNGYLTSNNVTPPPSGYSNWNRAFSYTRFINTDLSWVIIPEGSNTDTMFYTDGELSTGESITAIGTISENVSFGGHAFDLNSAKIILNSLDDNVSGKTLTFSTSTKALINADTEEAQEVRDLIAQKRLVGWTISY